MKEYKLIPINEVNVATTQTCPKSLTHQKNNEG